MLRADTARMEWNADKNQWHVVITIGAEVIKRWLPKTPAEANEETLRTMALETAKDEGYELEAAQVSIAH